MLEVSTNMMGVNTQRQGTTRTNELREVRENLASGLRNDSRNGTANSELNAALNSGINSLNISSRNISAGNTVIRTAENTIGQTSEILNRTRELAVRAANDTLSTENRNAIYREISSNLNELERISETAQFNTRNLLDGSNNLFFQVGSNSGQQIGTMINEVSIEALGLEDYSETFYNAINTGNLHTGETISTFINDIDSSLEQVGAARINLDAIESRLNFANENVNIVRGNLTSASSRIIEADTAFEALRAMQELLLEEAQTTMLAQANQHQGAVMRLLI